MVRESLQQYKDYYESDKEEQSFFEYMDNMTNRDKIRFMETFKDFTELHVDSKQYAMIRKREYNPELSVFSNLVLDLVDFKDRVRPMASDITLLDVSSRVQKFSMKHLEEERAAYMKEIKESEAKERAGVKDEGYSSGEIEAPKKRQK